MKIKYFIQITDLNYDVFVEKKVLQIFKFSMLNIKYCIAGKQNVLEWRNMSESFKKWRAEYNKDLCCLNKNHR